MTAPLAIDSRRAAYFALVVLTLIWGSNWAVRSWLPTFCRTSAAR